MDQIVPLLESVVKIVARACRPNQSSIGRTNDDRQYKDFQIPATISTLDMLFNASQVGQFCGSRFES